MQRHFNSTGMVRLLGAWQQPQGTGLPRPDVAEQLGQGLNAFDAVQLNATLHALQGVAPAQACALPASETAALHTEFQRVRTMLTQTIHAKWAMLAPSPPDADVAFAPYRGLHLELQHHMAAKITPLRQRARQTLARATPRLRQLATLDAALEQALAAREHKLLATVPGHLEQRFEQLRATPSTPATQQPNGGWLHTFTTEHQDLLLAELHTRLLPVAGLIEALSQETTTQP